VTAAATLRALPAAGSADTGYGHVLAGVELGGPARRLAALLDPSFLSEAGWDPAGRVLSLPAGHRCWAARYAGPADAPRRSTRGSAGCATGASPGCPGRG
jgi:hypothetical protein